MCDPVTIAGTALSGASMLANNAAQRKVAKARSASLSAERSRQRTLQAEADTINEGSRGRYDSFKEQQDAKGAQLAAYFTGQNQNIPQGQGADGVPSEPLPSSSNNIVVNEQERQRGKARAFGEQQAAALGQLRSFADLLGGISRLQARDASRVGTLGGFMRGSSAVLPLELEAANSKGGGMRMLGDVLGGLGQVGISAGLGGASDQIFGREMQGPLLPGQTRPIVRGSGSVGSILTRNGFNPFS